MTDDLDTYSADQPIPLVPTTPNGGRPRKARVHKRIPGDETALCGFVFTPANRCSLAEAVSKAAPECAACEVEYLHLIWDLS